VSQQRAYKVPTTLCVFPSISFELNIFASPKSEIFGFISESKRMLLALTSLCITRNRECLCKYKSPCAIPSIITSRLSQFSKVLLVSSAHQLNIKQHRKYYQTLEVVYNMDCLIIKTVIPNMKKSKLLFSKYS